MTVPITPPPELVEQWRRTAPHPANETEHYHYITLCAAQWGADTVLTLAYDYVHHEQKNHPAVYLGLKP